jgi:hypothetical protein
MLLASDPELTESDMTVATALDETSDAASRLTVITKVTACTLLSEGESVGIFVGTLVGACVAISVGAFVGASAGDTAAPTGIAEGVSDGLAVGDDVGDEVGDTVGDTVGDDVGSALAPASLRFAPVSSPPTAVDALAAHKFVFAARSLSRNTRSKNDPAG